MFDPDLGRLRMGLRATLATGLGALLISFIGNAVGFAQGATLLGAAIAMMASVFATDATPSAQSRTTLLMALPACAMIALATFVSPHHVATVIVFVAVVFGSVWVRRYGARGTALGMIAFNAFFFALFFKIERPQLPSMLCALLLGIAIAWVTRFVLVRDRSQRMIRSTVRALDATVAAVLRELSEAVLSPSPRRERHLRRTLARLNETALLLESELPLNDATRGRSFRAEIAAGRLVASVRELGLGGALTVEQRGALAAALRSGEPVAQARLPGVTDPLSRLLLSRVDAALTDLSRALESPASFAELPARPTPEPAPGMHAATRQAIQASVAATLSMIAGRLISPDRWFWAVLAAFIVLTRASTTEEILVRAWHRVAGTVGGVAVGMGVAAAVHGHSRVELVLLFVCVFLAFHSLRGSYALMVAWITTVVALLYALMGRPSTGLLIVRIEETIAGAAIGAIVAALVLPTRTRGKVELALQSTLRAVADVLEGFGRGVDDAVLRSLARRVDAELRDLREAAEPLTRRVFSLSNDTSAALRAAAGLAFYARQLSHVTLPTSTERHVLAERAAALANALRSGNVSDDRAMLHDAASRFAVVDDGLALAAVWLRRMNELAAPLGELARR